MSLAARPETTRLSCRDLKLRGALIFGKELKLLELEQLYNKVRFPRFLFAEHLMSCC